MQAPSASGGTQIQISIEEGTYSPSNMRGPSDALDGVDFGTNKSGENKVGQRTSDGNGKVIIDSVGFDFDLTPEVPGIKIDSALKNILLNGLDTIILEIVVDNNIIRLKGSSVNSSINLFISLI